MEVIYMSNAIAETVTLLELLPEDDISLVNNLVKKLVKAWDPDFTKLTPSEAEELNEIVKLMDKGEYVTDSDINW